jgi:hypothetical protein
MAHNTEVVEVVELGDEIVAYRVRCCGEKLTDSWHSASVVAPDLEQSLQSHKDRVAALHEAKLLWREKNAVTTSRS